MSKSNPTDAFVPRTNINELNSAGKSDLCGSITFIARSHCNVRNWIKRDQLPLIPSRSGTPKVKHKKFLDLIRVNCSAFLTGHSPEFHPQWIRQRFKTHDVFSSDSKY